MVALTGSIAALLLAAASGNALPQSSNGVSPVPAKSPTVTSASWSGNGCPQGSVEFVPGDPDQALDTGIAVFRRYYTAIGSDWSPTSKTANCQAHINVKDIEPGWQFAVKTLKVSGYADIDNANLTVYATSYFSQNPRDTVTKQFTQPGPIDSAVTIEVPFDEAGPWSPCGSTGILNINFRTSFTSSAGNKASGYFGAGNGVPYVTEKIEYVWRKCT